MKHKIFISYAHEDADMLEELLTALKPQLDRLDASCFTDTQMTAGVEFHDRLKLESLTSSAVIYLVSNAFLQSRYCQSFEMTWGMRKAGELDAVLIPVILEMCDWHATSLRHLNVTPPQGKPITHYETIAAGMAVVVKAVEAALNDETRHLYMGPTALAGGLAVDQIVERFDSERAPSIGGLGTAAREIQDGLAAFDDLLHHGAQHNSHTREHDHARHPAHDEHDHHSEDDEASDHDFDDDDEH